MTHPKVVTRDEWLAARLDLLKDEKELTRRSDELARRRTELPWVRIDQPFRFETDAGSVSLADLFKGRSQLLVYHFMFGPDYQAGCPSCSSIADGFNGIVAHLEHHDVAFSAVSRAPLAKLQAFKQRMGWTFPWASSSDGAFNFEFNVSYSEEQVQSGDIVYNFRRAEGARASDEPESEHRWSTRFARNGGDGSTHLRARSPGGERVRLAGRGGVPHLFHVCARPGRPVEHVPVAGSCAPWAQRKLRS